MFYADNIDEMLRFGDVLDGIVLSAPELTDLWGAESYSINVQIPKYCVVLTPCCSIKESTIHLAPLVKLKNTFFRNPYLREDMTNINRVMAPEKTLAPQDWEILDEVKKNERLAEGNTYGFRNYFVYDGHELFSEYEINLTSENIMTKDYMINFKDAYKINCNDIIKHNNSPVSSKRLQLSIETRSELRAKIEFFYGRPAKEDIVDEERL